MSSELEEEIKSLREHLRRKAVVELKQVGALRQQLQTTVGRLDTLEKDIRRDMSKAQVSGVSSMRQELLAALEDVEKLDNELDDGRPCDCSTWVVRKPIMCTQPWTRGKCWFQCCKRGSANPHTRAASLVDLASSLESQGQPHHRTAPAGHCQPAAAMRYIHSIQSNASQCNNKLEFQFTGSGVGADMMMLLLALHRAMLLGRPLAWSADWWWTTDGFLDSFDIFPPLSACQSPRASTLHLHRERADSSIPESQQGIDLCYGYGNCAWASQLPEPFSRCGIVWWFSQLATALIRPSHAAISAIWPNASLPFLRRGGTYIPYKSSLLWMLRHSVLNDLPAQYKGFHFRRGDACLEKVKGFRPPCPSDEQIRAQLQAIRAPAMVVTDSAAVKHIAREACGLHCQISSTDVYSLGTSLSKKHHKSTIEFRRDLNRTQVLIGTVRDISLLALSSEIHASFYSNFPRIAYLLGQPSSYTSSDALWCPFVYCRVGYASDPNICTPRWHELERGTMRGLPEVALDGIHQARRDWVRAVRTTGESECKLEVMRAVSRMPKVY